MDFHFAIIKADKIRQLLPNWNGADGCIATAASLVQGCKVGYYYRERPEGRWDSGWRFTAGDESDAYIDDPICNDDPCHHSTAAYALPAPLSGMRMACSSTSKIRSRNRRRRNKT